MNLRDKSRLKKLSKVFLQCTEDKQHVIRGVQLSDAAYTALLVPCPNLKAKKVGKYYLISLDQMDGLLNQIEGHKHEI